jgi:hypothetical protein
MSKVDIADEWSAMFVGAVVTKIERRGDYVRWHLRRDDGQELTQEWYSPPLSNEGGK